MSPWTLSQAYYFGSVNHSPAHRVELVDGEPIDDLDELDQIAIGPAEPPRGRAREAGDGSGARGDADLVRRIVTGDGYHTELCALAARYIGRGIDPRAVGDVLRGLMLAQNEPERDERWQDRFRSIPQLVASARRKYQDEYAPARRTIAAAAWTALERGGSADDIANAAIAAGEAAGVPMSMVQDVLSYIHARRGGRRDA